MPRPITVDEVASFPYAGIAPSELSPDCELSADGLRVAYTHRTRIHITELETSNTYKSFRGLKQIELYKLRQYSVKFAPTFFFWS